MIFSDPPFFVFFAIVFGLYLVLTHRWQNRMLLVASYTFYGFWDWRFLSLILFSTVVDYFVGLAMEKATDEKKRRLFLIISLVSNLGLLAIFKYLNFFADSFASLMQALGIPVSDLTLGIVLPVGISFYTFQTLSYTIDIYRRQLKPTRNFLDFALFVSFFPQLVAGPIERAKNLLPNVTQPRTVTVDNIGRGLVLCLIGLIKKVVIADAVAGAVDQVYSAPDPTGTAVYIGTLLFAVQIYCDFSGYTDIARGLSKMLGFELMRNFAQPYFATSPQSFWRRWHISLSTWLRDYLYIPLGGNRNGERQTYRNLTLTMLLGGLWHGAAWNFVAWGLYHGGLLAVNRKLSQNSPSDSPAQTARAMGLKALKLLGFFHLTLYGWLLFRAESFAQIADMTGKLLQPWTWPLAGSGAPTVGFTALLGMAAILTWDLVIERTNNTRFYEAWPLPLRAVTYAVLIYLLAFGATTSSEAFIYFQF